MANKRAAPAAAPPPKRHVTITDAWTPIQFISDTATRISIELDQVPRRNIRYYSRPDVVALVREAPPTVNGVTRPNESYEAMMARLRTIFSDAAIMMTTAHRDPSLAHWLDYLKAVDQAERDRVYADEMDNGARFHRLQQQLPPPPPPPPPAPIIADEPPAPSVRFPVESVVIATPPAKPLGRPRRKPAAVPTLTAATDEVAIIQPVSLSSSSAEPAPVFEVVVATPAVVGVSPSPPPPSNQPFDDM